jgi:hypothetical protein
MGQPADRRQTRRARPATPHLRNGTRCAARRQAGPRPTAGQARVVKATDLPAISGHSHLRLGEHPFLLPPAVARLIGQQATAAAARPPAPDGTRWLFPGRASVRRLTALAATRPLSQHGIHVHAGRAAAFVDLAGQLPPAVLAACWACARPPRPAEAAGSPATGPHTCTHVPSARRHRRWTADGTPAQSSSPTEDSYICIRRLRRGTPASARAHHDCDLAVRPGCRYSIAGPGANTMTARPGPDGEIRDGWGPAMAQISDCLLCFTNPPACFKNWPGWRRRDRAFSCQRGRCLPGGLARRREGRNRIR